MKIFRFTIDAFDSKTNPYKVVPTLGFVAGENYAEAVENLVQYWGDSNVESINVYEIESGDCGVLMDFDITRIFKKEGVELC